MFRINWWPGPARRHPAAEGRIQIAIAFQADEVELRRARLSADGQLGAGDEEFPVCLAGHDFGMRRRHGGNGNDRLPIPAAEGRIQIPRGKEASGFECFQPMYRSERGTQHSGGR